MHVPTATIAEINISEVESLFKESSEPARRSNQKKKMVELSRKEADSLMSMTREKRKGWMRNRPCVCNSGKKFKRCCWNEYS